MKKLQSLLLIAGIILALNGFSQTTGFDLSKYRLPNLDRRELSTRFDLTGAHSYADYPDDMISRPTKTANNRFNGNFTLDYNHFLNSVRFQQQVNMGIDFSSSIIIDKMDGDIASKNNRVAPQCYIDFANRTYYRPKWYYETDILLNFNYDYRKLYYSDSYYNEEREETPQAYQMLLQLPLKFGHGRIEQVQDARLALYIIDELAKAGRMQADLSDDQIIEFASLISELKNKRYFDARLRRIADLESVDSFLVAKQYVNEQDIRYFTTLNDMWSYGGRPVRNSGTRISVAAMPGYDLTHYKNNDDGIGYPSGKYNINAFILDGGFELKHESPMNLYWQNTIDVVAYGGIANGKIKEPDTDKKSTFKFPSFRAGYYQTFGYYPNTRTEMNLGYSAEYIHYFDKSDMQNDIYGLDAQGAKGSINFDFNYYISLQLRLYAYCSFYYIWQDSKDEINISFDPTTGGAYFLENDVMLEMNYSYYVKNRLESQYGVRLVYMIF